ncbi:response regulator [Brevibacillus dissolubilis]|uniref:response regulator n=1 Tax=Brevibacillus dissolubilis TaxID=1844116 RepID=UPI001115DE4C|nr:response regulator [Brevibacillus dissolubilis]
MAKVLIVDDAAFMRQMLAQMLSGEHEVCGEATTGVEAIEKYKEVQPDIVTMDITMPDMMGTEAVREILKLDPTAKIVMCSAMGQRHMVLEAMKLGAKDFIVKPFQKDNILHAISKYV